MIEKMKTQFDLREFFNEKQPRMLDLEIVTCSAAFMLKLVKYNLIPKPQ